MLLLYVCPCSVNSPSLIVLVTRIIKLKSYYQNKWWRQSLPEGILTWNTYARVWLLKPGHTAHLQSQTSMKSVLIQGGLMSAAQYLSVHSVSQQPMTCFAVMHAYIWGGKKAIQLGPLTPAPSALLSTQWPSWSFRIYNRRKRRRRKGWGYAHSSLMPTASP